MSFEAMAMVSHLNYNDIPELKTLQFKQSHKLILYSMANYADNNFQLFPSYDTLAQDSCSCRRTCIQSVKYLIELGLISKTIRPGLNGNNSNIYRLSIVEFLKKNGYFIQANERGFMQAIKSTAQQNQGVQNLHPPSAESAPDPITDPIPRLLTSDNEIFPTFTDIPFDKMSIAVTQLKTTFGKRFDDDWYKLVFEMFCCSNDEKRNPVPNQHDLQLQFRKYATNTGKHDQQRDARANNTKDKSLERIEAHKKTQADKWHSSYDKVPEIALMELTMANLSHIANDVWNSYVTNQINYNQNFKEASQLKYDFEDFIKRNEFRLKKQAQQLQVTQDSNDLSWVDELNDEIARGERLDSFTDVRSEKQIN